MHLADRDHTHGGIGAMLVTDLGTGEALGLGRGESLPPATGSDDGLEKPRHREKGNTVIRLVPLETAGAEIVVVNTRPAGDVAGLLQGPAALAGGAVGTVTLPGVSARSLPEVEDTSAKGRSWRDSRGGRGRGVRRAEDREMVVGADNRVERRRRRGRSGGADNSGMQRRRGGARKRRGGRGRRRLREER